MSNQDIFLLQITVLARDHGTPESRVGPSARVVVNVLRNTQTPRFSGTPYVKNITEAQETNSVIFTVRAEDRDQKVFYIVFGLEKPSLIAI